MNIKSIVILIITIGINACNSTRTYEKKLKPNILFIVVDDLGFNDLSCMGSPFYETPNIDRITEKGIVFTNGYSSSSVCSPSRASLLTGKFPARHGITEWIGAKSGDEWRESGGNTKLLPADYLHNLPSEYRILPEILSENGYKTFFAGKWHLGDVGSYPEDHGFDVNKGGYEIGGPYSGGYFSPFNNPKLVDYKEEIGISLQTKLANETIEFIENNKDKPFLAYLSFYAVHSPIQTSQDKWSKYRDKIDSIGIPEIGFGMGKRLPVRLNQDNPVYAGLIEQVDDAIGSIQKAIKGLNIEENTIVIFTSDNGGVISGDDFSTNLSPLKGGKGYQWEGGTRVPFFIQVPWMNLSGQKETTPVIGTDFYPTILELAGIPREQGEHADGISLVPLLKNESITSRPLYWHYPHYSNQGGEPSSIIRNGKWKLIHYWEDGHVELYDLEVDLSESKDVAAKEPQIANKLDRDLISWLESVGAKYPKENQFYDEETFLIKQRKYESMLLNRLEKKRNDMLSLGWQPNGDWWGSKINEQTSKQRK